MNKKLLIDAAHAEEIRIAVVSNDGNLDEFDSESCTKKQAKGNIYLAKVVRIEPSLQAAFVDYGGERHGFLPFSEIHPDYYRIPVSDREKEDLEKEKSEEIESTETENSEAVETDQPVEKKVRYRYKIQEVIQKRQIILVQVVKEQRGNKGASLTTYLSLAGRYCVLMPNAGKRSGGISRKISDDSDRKRLKEVLKGLEIPEGMSLIVRTAGHERSKIEIKRDYDYLIKLWEEIREKTLQSVAPCLVQEESNLIKRAVRDIYSKEIDEILVEGEQAYKDAKAFMKVLIPSHAKKVQLYKDPQTPLFHKFNVENHIDKMMFPRVDLPSGGYIIINHTEALVSIDVNSGRATKERNIEITAFKTNMEAAQEVARQLRLRDLAGLIVVDFIDMEDNSNINNVERKFKESLKFDRARIQVGKISQFGLLEMSRQRLRPSMMETHSSQCLHCHGTGIVRSTESLALQILRATEKEAVKGKAQELQIAVPKGIELYLLNYQRRDISRIEDRYNIEIFITRENLSQAPYFRIDVLKQKENLLITEETETTEENVKKPKHKNNKHNSSEKVLEKTDELIPEVTATTEELKTTNQKKKNNRYKKHKKNVSTAEQTTTTENEKAVENNEEVSSVITETHSDLIAPQFGKKRKRWNNKKPKKIIDNQTQNTDYQEISKEAVTSNENIQEVTEAKIEKKSSKKKGNWLRRLLE